MNDIKIGLFLGAGASSIFGYPTTIKMMDKLQNRDEIEKFIPDTLYKNGNRDVIQNIHSFFSAPEFHNNRDLEHLLHTVYKLEKLPNEFETDFLLNKTIKVNDSGSFFSVGYFIQSYIPIIKVMIHKLIFASYKWDDKKSKFFDVYSKLFDKIITLSGSILPIFTTNYDSVIEHFCEGPSPFNLIDGFKLSKNSFIWNNGDFDSLIDSSTNNILLFKLHGSLTWEKRGQSFFRVLGKEDYSSGEANILIYPTFHPKDVENIEPFSTLLNNFKDKLNELNILIVIGFSFRDTHINKFIIDFVNVPSHRLIIISPTATTDIEKEIVSVNVFGNITVIEESAYLENIDNILKIIENKVTRN